MRARSGFVIIAVLWLTTAMSFALAGLAGRLRVQRLAAQNVIERIQLRAAVDGAAELALRHIEVATPKPQAGLPLVLASHEWVATVGEQEVLIRIEDAGARVNLNVASPEQVRALFDEVLPDGQQAAEALLDWADADDVARDGGLESIGYAEAGAPTRPANRLLAASDELCAVRYIEDACVELLPLVSTDGPAGVNVNTASRHVLMSLPGFTRPAVDEVLRRQRSGEPIVTMFELASSLEPGARNAMLAEWTALQAGAVVATTTLWVTLEARGSAAIAVRSEMLVDVTASPPRVVRRVLL